MCNACCAATAIENTARGSWFSATWSTKPPPRSRRVRRPRRIVLRRIVNNPDAPPLADAAPTLADLQAGTEPYLLIQAEGEAEGPGRVRYGFDGETWTAWQATDDVAREMLGADVVWFAVRDEIKSAITSRSAADVEQLLLQRAQRDSQIAVGRRITAYLPEGPGRAGTKEAMRVLHARVRRELDGADLLAEGRPLLLDLLTWVPHQPFPRSPKGLRVALRRHLRNTAEEASGASALRQGLYRGLFRVRELTRG